MTTWQDQPPMSRRALREQERARARAQQVPGQQEPVQQPPGQQAPGQQPAAAGYHAADYEEARSLVRTEDPVDRQVEHQSDYRAHDFSPDAQLHAEAQSQTRAEMRADSRGTSFSATIPEQSVPDAHPIFQPPAAAPTSRSSAHNVAETGPIERTLTRRQVRALREQAERQAAYEIPTLVEPAAYGTGLTTPVAPPPVVPAPVSPPPVETPPVTVGPIAAPPIADEPLTAEPTPLAPAALLADAAYAAPAEGELAHPERGIVAAPEYYQPPVGHWSTQHTIDDELQASGVLSRDLSASNAITTSALVLPSLPSSPVAPVTGTGEILVTGTIDLPRSLGASGLHPTGFDHSDVDAMFEASDREDAAPNSAPVRANRAVSTQTSSHGMIATKRPQSGIPTMALAVCAAVMGVGVAVLFVGALVLDIF